jgi:hypothetical protein
MDAISLVVPTPIASVFSPVSGRVNTMETVVFPLLPASQACLLLLSSTFPLHFPIPPPAKNLTFPQDLSRGKACVLDHNSELFFHLNFIAATKGRKANMAYWLLFAPPSEPEGPPQKQI